LAGAAQVGRIERKAMRPQRVGYLLLEITDANFDEEYRQTCRALRRNDEPPGASAGLIGFFK